MQPICPYFFFSGAMFGAMFAATAIAQGPGPGVFATQVIGYQTNGNAGGGIFNPSNALGAPDGPLGVHSLGIAGELTLGFAVPITDGPGADLIVGENAFRPGANFWASFAEMMFVEVSSDGLHFARFPSRYYGPPQQPGFFGSVAIGSYANLAGQHPVLATDPLADARDVVEAGGDAFDLALLAGHPLVTGALVDLQAITQVRLVDVVSGSSLDSSGQPIFDAGAGSADVDAVTAIHQFGLVDPGTPSVALTILPDGTITLRFEDPDGWQDLDPNTVHAALFGIPIDVGNLLGAFQVQSSDALGFTLVQPVPLPAGLRFTLSFSLKDLSGNRSGQSLARPD